MRIRALGLLVAINLDIFTLRAFRKFFRLFKSTELNRVVCFSAEGTGNLGSRALTISTIKNLPSETLFIGSGDFQNFVSQEGIASDRTLILPQVYPKFSFGHWADLIRLSRATAKTKMVFIVGADMLDGYYSDSLSGLHWAVALGLSGEKTKVRVLGFSWNAKATSLAAALCSRAARNNVELMARDSYSFSRLKPIAGRNVQLASDIVFASFRAEPVPNFGETERLLRSVVIAGNPAGRGTGREFDPKIFAPMFAALSKSHNFIFVPSVIRAGQDDSLEFAKVTKSFPSYRNILIQNLIPTPQEFIKLVQQADLLISFRMHPAILATIAHTPVLLLDYQDKMAGLATDLGIPELCLPEEFDLAELSKMALATISRSPEISEVLGRSVPKMQMKAQANFQFAI
jgi:polysaccharide pyruvyl transferase WcaK-like protein